MKMKKIIAMLLAAMMVIGMLAACGGDADTTTAAGENNGEAKKYDGVELNFWSMWNSTEPQAEVIKQAVEAFKAETGAVVNVEWKGREINQVLTASLESKEKIDIFEDDYQRIAQVYGEYTYDLTDMAKAAGYTGYDCLNNQAIEWTGYLSSIVEQPQVGGVFYDKDAFAAAGITAEPTTWAEFLDVCQKLKDAGYQPLALDSAYSYFTFYYHLVRHLGEPAIEQLAMNGGWSDSAAVTAAQEIIDFVKAGYLADGAPDEYPSSQNKIGFGQAAMIVCANYVTSEVNNNAGVQINWGLFNYPAVEGGVENTAAYAGANSLAVSSYSENAQAAFDFIMLLTTGKYDQLMADTAAQIPADSKNTAPAHLTGTIETLLAAERPMTWCNGTNANNDLSTNFKSMFNELYEGKYASGEEFCAALDALYK
ncbi:MAG: carbohydrate ABC transporter substrate-binding protein [Lachnospiraceae bacterium]|nr:carbohydrate ABC transporter substrate-binding protein [Lachnospiraceae bacterium]